MLLAIIFIIYPIASGKGVEINFETQPIGSQIYMDDVLIGQSPEIIRIPPKTHRFKIEHPYFEPVVFDKNFGSLWGGRSRHELKLIDLRGLLSQALGSLRVWAMAGPFDADHPYPKLISSTLAKLPESLKEQLINEGATADNQDLKLIKDFVLQSIAQAADESIWEDLLASLKAYPELLKDPAISDALDRAWALKDNAAQSDTLGEANETDLLPPVTWAELKDFLAANPTWSRDAMLGSTGIDPRVDEHYLAPLARGVIEASNAATSFSYAVAVAYAKWLSDTDASYSYRLPRASEWTSATPISAEDTMLWFWTADCYESLALGLSTPLTLKGEVGAQDNRLYAEGLALVLRSKDTKGNVERGIYQMNWCPPIVAMRLIREAK